MKIFFQILVLMLLLIVGVALLDGQKSPQIILEKSDGFVGTSVFGAIPPTSNPDTVNVIVEIPKGSMNKYEIDKELGVIKLDRVLFSAVHYPGDYGIIPQTSGGDGDPLDVLVLVTYPTFPGALIEAAPIGVLRTVDSGDVDDKIIAVPIGDVRFKDMRNIGDVNKALLDEISNFFATYKQLEGKEVEILGYEGANDAKRIIAEAVMEHSNQ